MPSAEERMKKAVENRTITLPDGTILPSIGQGTWHMGEKPSEKKAEVKALQLGLDLGMKVIDTAEMYGSGGAEHVVKEAVQGRREEAFIVSKALPHNAGGDKLIEACENSLKRMSTDYMDLYLLHWRGSIPLRETIQGMEQLQKDGKILRWGVSNLDTSDMQELWETEGGQRCMTNQVLYHLGSRGIEFDLLPWQRDHAIPTMAYSPLAQGGSLRRSMMEHPELQAIAETHKASVQQILLSWVLRTGDILAIPKAVQEEHVYDNAAAAAVHLTEDDVIRLDQAFKPPEKKQPLDII
ncbi:aldo/keto reductase [Salibacterium aidingense]|uniref:aldo/keto reductase n=1 Tax=Salibacterium aidingense TaxID=384933 RepID=UPI00041F6779|nr:aldo/keto reductase [Salibacterium aidingense]